MIKYCPACQRTLPVSAFAIRNASKDGLSSRCKTCKNAANRAEYSSNAELRSITRKRVALYRQTEEGKAKRREQERNRRGADAGCRAADTLDRTKMAIIRVQSRQGVSIEELAKRFGVRLKTIRGVIRSCA